MRRLFLTLLWAACAAFAIAPAVRADGVSNADVRGVRAVVQAQLEAFAADDATRAFSFAAPALREMFGTAERFVAMVRSSYPVVYRPAAVAFEVPEAAGAEVVQRVHFTDSAGALWLATYRLQRQPDNNWRISGCVLAQSRALTT